MEEAEEEDHHYCHHYHYYYYYFYYFFIIVIIKLFQTVSASCKSLTDGAHSNYFCVTLSFLSDCICNNSLPITGFCISNFALSLNTTSIGFGFS